MPVSGRGVWRGREMDRIRELEDEVERLREAIRKAPHAKHCEAGSPMWPGPCNCWKAAHHAG